MVIYLTNIKQQFIFTYTEIGIAITHNFKFSMPIIEKMFDEEGTYGPEKQ